MKENCSKLTSIAAIICFVLAMILFGPRLNAQEKKQEAKKKEAKNQAQVQIQIGKDGSVQIYDMQGNPLNMKDAKPQTEKNALPEIGNPSTNIDSLNKSPDAKPQTEKNALPEVGNPSLNINSLNKSPDAKPQTEKNALPEVGSPSLNINSLNKSPDAKPQAEKNALPEVGNPSTNIDSLNKSPDAKPQMEKSILPEVGNPSTNIDSLNKSPDAKPQTEFLLESSKFSPMNTAASPNLAAYTGSGAVNNYSYNGTTHGLTINFSVQNNGTASAGSFRVGFYLSENTTITTSDRLVATATQSSLTNGYYINKSATVDLDNVSGLPAGTYYVAVIIDDQNQIAETNENDNAVYYTPTIPYQNGTPNLAAYTGSGAVNNYSYNGTTHALTINFSVQNNGTASAGGFRLGFYLSDNTTITTSDYLVATATQSSLTNGYYINKSATVDLDNVSGLPSGTYYVAAIIDDQNQVAETNENDNAVYYTPTISYQNGTPNLAAYTGSGAVNNYSYNGTTHALTINFSVQNNGTASAGGFRVGFYLSENTTITTSDYLVATATQSSLTNGYYINKSATVDLDNVSGLPAGTYYVASIIDDQNQIAETNENDNAVYYTPTIIYQNGNGTPNLATYTGSGAVNNYSYDGTTHVLVINSSVQNNGDASAGGFRVGYYLSDNTTITTSDNLVATATQGSLTNGYYINKSATVDLDNVSGLPAGTYYVAFIIDDQNQVFELSENDNGAYFTPTITHPPDRPSLALTVKNIPTGNQSLPGNNGIVKLYNNSGTLVDTKTTVNGVATFTTIPEGSGYYYKVFHNPSNPSTIFGEEYWGQKTGVNIITGQTTSETFTRNMPYATDVRAYDNSTNQEVTGNSVASGTQLRIEVTILNPNSASQNVKGRVVLDRDKTASYDFDQTSSSYQTVTMGGTVKTTFTYTPTTTGLYYAVVGAITNVNGTGLYTDGWAWGNNPLFRVGGPEIDVTPTQLTITQPSASSAKNTEIDLNDFVDLSRRYVQDELIVKLKADLPVHITNAGKTAGLGISTIDRIFERFGSDQIQKVYALDGSDPLLMNTFKVHLAKASDLQAAIREIQSLPEVEFVHPNYLYVINDVPNDPDYSQQWHLAQVHAADAWDHGTGSQNVAIGIIDSGVDWDHPDLAANIWTNSGEIPGNGKDDDANGYVDDIRGWDWLDGANNAATGEDGQTPDNNPMDFDGHGTHVAGIASAVTNNGVGVAGIARGCRIMALRAGYRANDGQGYVRFDAAVAAIRYAVAQGARVINMSFGGGTELLASVTHAYNNNVVVVHAAGNENTSAASPIDGINQTISVAATDQNDVRAFFSNYGNWIDVSAPGVSIRSTLFNDGYGSLSGTSMASPLVAGLAALIISQNTSLTNAQVTNIITSTADNIDQVNPQFTGQLGAGRINAFNAVQRVVGTNTFTIQNIGGAQLTINSITDDSGWLSTTGYPGTPFNIAPGSSQLVTVNVDWASVGGTTRTGQVAIASNDQDEPKVTVNVTAIPRLQQPILSVTPSFRDVPASSGSTSFDIANTGAGTMNWTAVSNAPWLTITSGSSGTNSGSINVNYAANTGSARVGTITVTASGATGSPKIVEVRQAGTNGNQVTFSIPTDLTGGPGSTVQIPLNIDPKGKQIGSFDARVNFDNTVLSYAGTHSNGPAIPPGWNVDVNENNSNGWVQIGAFAGSGNPLTAAGTAVLLSFKVNSNATVGIKVPLPLSNLAATDNNANTLPVIGTNGAFTVQTSTAKINGQLRYFANSKPLQADTVRLVDNSTSAEKMSISQTSGAFEINDIPLGKNYTLAPRRIRGNYPQPGAITSGDALKAFQGRFGGPVPLTSGYEALAADVNGDQQINSGDALAILKRATGALPHFRQFSKDDWCFVDADFPITPANAFTAPRKRSYNNLSGDQVKQDFIGIILGDLNGSFGTLSSAISKSGAGEDNKTRSVAIAHQSLAAGVAEVTFTVDIRAIDGAYNSFDLMLTFDGERMHITNVSLGPTFSAKDWQMSWNESERGLLRIASFSMNEAAIEGKGTLVAIKAALIQPAKEGQSLSIQIPSVLFGLNGQEVFGQGESGNLQFAGELPQQYALDQNYPNPFNPETTIRYELPEAGDVSLRVYDVMGHTVRTLATGRQSAGAHIVKWNGRKDDGTPAAGGVYFYHLETATFAKTNKLILLK